ncbi:CAP domain-containing protein [Candidatus Gottesmanbacteria bacterium]|nr:CAP domain-containing protein [Candidatus Gottesmanbacteria bacterium]
MRRKKRRLIYFIPFFLVVFVLFMWFYVRINVPTLSPLAKLSIPTNAQVYLPDPLQITPFSAAVLGAETIEGNDIVYYVNLERQKVGAAPLQVNNILTESAKKRAEVILKYQNFSHTDPYEGVQLPKVVEDLGYYFKYVSENIGMGGSSAKDFVFGFTNSTLHRENLLNPELVESGVGVVTGPYKEYYVNIAVQLFAIPSTKEEYFGYGEKDVVYYEGLLSQIEENLSFTNSQIGEGRTNQDYYIGWRDLLLRQKTIISRLLLYMREDKPFVKEQLTLVYEYNNNWNKAPKL